MKPNDLFKFVSLRPARPIDESGRGAAQRRLRDIREREAKALAEQSAAPVTAPAANATSALRKQHAELQKMIDTYEALQRAAHRAFVATRTESESPAAPAPPRTRARRTAATVVSATAARASSTAIDGTFYRALEGRLGAAERTALNTAIARIPGGAPVDFDMLIEGLSLDPMIGQANTICSQLRALETSDGSGLPTVESTNTALKPVISAIGWGDLVIARETLIGYEAREVAHIENVLPGESKVRVHERKSKTEQVDELETETEKEAERDSQSTDRYELQTQTQDIVQRDFAINAGVNTSGRYGLTKVDTSLDTAFSDSASQSRSNSINTAREIVSRSVEKTYERVRKLRRLTVTEELRELNRHKLSNIPTEGSQASAISGIYMWVEKVQQIELRHYGTRLMLELHVPEPALSLLERGQIAKRPRVLPPFELGPNGVNEANYLCLAERYGATDIDPPPAPFIKVGFTWASASNEEAEDDGESTISETVSIPQGYAPISATTFVSALEASKISASSGSYDFSLAIGGVTAVKAKGATQVDTVVPLTPSPWPNGVPITGRVHGHWDNTLAVQVTFHCERTREAMIAWRLRTWEALRAGYSGLERALSMDNEKQALARQYITMQAELPEAENRRLERAELQKWCVKALRLKPQNFNAIEQVGDFQEMNPFYADMQAPLVRFYEDAFEWEHMSYFLYPYYWARRESWKMRNETNAIDPRFRAFLEAGAARVIVPVTPGYEARVLAFLESDPSADEMTRINGAIPTSVPVDSLRQDIWREILVDLKADVALGSGTLNVTHQSTAVTINDDSNWHASARDLGRELYIDGEHYIIAAVTNSRNIEIDRDYRGRSHGTAVYAAGSVPFGPPWTVNVPTTLVVLADNHDALAQLR